MSQKTNTKDTASYTLGSLFKLVLQNLVTPYLALLILILTFYWTWTLSLVMPTGDGAIPVAYYSYLYSGYLTYNKILLWNPFLVGGAINNFMSYVYMGFSPLNPLIHLWLPVSKMLNIEILRSFYFYYMLNIYLSGIFVYKLGKEHLFSNKLSGFFLAVIFSISGFFVSMVGLFYYIVPFSWFAITLYLGLNAIKNNGYKDYFLLALVTSIFCINGPTVVLPAGIFLFIFLIVNFVSQNVNIPIGQLLNKYLRKSVFFFLVFAFLILAPASYYINFMKNEGYHASVDLSYFFFGVHEKIADSNGQMDFYMLLNTFIPNSDLGRLFEYGSNGLWNNGFYYLGFISPILIFWGTYSLIKSKKDRAILISLLFSLAFAIFYAYGHSVLKIISPNIDLLTKYPKFSMPLVIFGLIILAGYGFNYIFTVLIQEGQNLAKAVIVPLSILWGVSCLILNFLSKIVGSDKLTPGLMIASLSYLFVVGVLYAISLSMKNAGVFVLVLILDLFFFLSSSWPMVSGSNTDTKNNFQTQILNTNERIYMPNSLGYSMSAEYPGMHFSVGPAMYREASAPRVSIGLMNERLAFWADKQLNEQFTSTAEMYAGLNILGVSKARYFLADHFYQSQEYNDIFPDLKKIYSSVAAKLQKNPLQNGEPVVINEGIPNFIPKLQKNDLNLISSLRTSHLNDYVDDLTSRTNSKMENFTIPGTELTTVLTEPNQNQRVLKYSGSLPNKPGFITESNIIENLCLAVTDGIDYYYPITGDIFHFISDRPYTNYRYIVPYRKFFSTYLDVEGSLRLFIRQDLAPTLPNLRVETASDCDVDLVTKLTDHEVTIKPNQLNFDKFSNGYNLFYSTKLAESEIPSYLGTFVNRFDVETVGKEEGAKFFREDKQYDHGFKIENRIFSVFKSFTKDPFIKDTYKITFSTIENVKETKDLTVTYQDPDKIDFVVGTEKPRILVVRNIYSTDWKAYVDKKRVKIFLVNGLYLGVPVPEGNHQVLVKYDPSLVKLNIAAVPLYGILIPLTILVIRRKKAKRG